MPKYFGTDGVRGVANGDLTPELAFAIGRAGAAVIAYAQAIEKPIVVGRDTRLSGPMLEGAIVAGITSTGRNVIQLGIVPTPAVASITAGIEAAAGVVISASHNPIEDNGIKFFGADGFKLSDAVESEIEALLDAPKLPRPTGLGIGVVTPTRGLIDNWFVALHAQDDGSRINVDCGATDLRALQTRVREEIARTAGPVVGVAFDGDADRALFVDERGEILDGDRAMLILARDLHARGELTGDTVVGTVMANMGFEVALAQAGIALLRAAVGDRYVLEALRAGGYRFGGEQSGHVIDLARGTTGDGPMTAVAGGRGPHAYAPVGIGRRARGLPAGAAQRPRRRQGGRRAPRGARRGRVGRARPGRRGPHPGAGLGDRTAGPGDGREPRRCTDASGRSVPRPNDSRSRGSPPRDSLR